MRHHVVDLACRAEAITNARGGVAAASTIVVRFRPVARAVLPQRLDGGLDVVDDCRGTSWRQQ